MASTTIIVPAFNAEKYLGNAVGSLLQQTHQDFELILVNDGSTDNTVSQMNSFGDPRIRVLSNGVNQGPAHARNRALDHAHREFVTFFDADDIARPGMLAALLTYLSRNPQDQGVTSWHTPINDQGLSAGQVLECNLPPERIPATMLFENRLGTSSMTLRRGAIGSLRFDETLPVASDYEMWMRVLRNHRIAILRDTLVGYRVHKGNISHRKQAQSEECVRTIIDRQLRHLGIAATKEEMDLHRLIPRLTVRTTLATVHAAETWLRMLAQKNQVHRVYDTASFQNELAERWFRVCFSACGNGWRMVGIFRNSLLSRYGHQAPAARRAFLRLALRGSIKKRVLALCAALNRTSHST